MTIDQLIQQASKLPEAERFRLAEHLLASLDGPADADADEAWAIEIARRSREIDEGKVQTVAWSDVKSVARRARGDRD